MRENKKIGEEDCKDARLAAGVLKNTHTLLIVV